MYFYSILIVSGGPGGPRQISIQSNLLPCIDTTQPADGAIGY